MTPSPSPPPPPLTSLFIILFSFVFFLLVLPSESKLSKTYYSKTCPQFNQIIHDTVTKKYIEHPTTAGGILRLFFHDCFVNGCDASVLITSTASNSAERDAEINHSLSDHAFDVIGRAKTTLELTCPGIVSCSDILVATTRDFVTMVGGPYYHVRLGRKDGLVSKASTVDGNLPKVSGGIDQNIKVFKKKGFSIKEMVALVGGHTIGFSQCKKFANRIFNYSKNCPVDPSLNVEFAKRLKKTCANYTKLPPIAVFLDVMTPGKFDNVYYQNLKRGLGLLSSDQALIFDTRTKHFAEAYATNQTAFFKAFAHAIKKLSVLEVKTGKKGEVRHKCDAFNA